MDTPKLVGIEQKADGWVKKYVLKYERPDGTPYEYDCASRHSIDDLKRGLERNGRICEEVLERASGENPEIEGGGASPAEPFSPDAVCIVARTPRNTLVMIREFRYPLNSWCIAFPAGLVDAGESFAESAGRELEEETGYSILPGTHVRALPQPGYSSTGMSDETVQVVFVEAEKTSEPHREANELIEVFELPISKARAFLDANKLPIGTRAQLILEIFATRQ